MCNSMRFVAMFERFVLINLLQFVSALLKFGSDLLRCLSDLFWFVEICERFVAICCDCLAILLEFAAAASLPKYRYPLSFRCLYLGNYDGLIWTATGTSFTFDFWNYYIERGVLTMSYNALPFTRNLYSQSDVPDFDGLVARTTRKVAVG